MANSWISDSETKSPEEKSRQLSAINWDRIEKFVGYGQRDARVVIIGMEEGLDKDADLLAELQLRSQFSQVMDLRESCRDVTGTEAIFDQARGFRQPVWRVVAFVMAWRELGRIPSSDERRRYRALRLGQRDGNVLLAELLPYPHPRSDDWLYSWRFDSRIKYEAAIFPTRVTILQEVLCEAPRELIVCYGKAKWGDFKSCLLGPNGSRINLLR